MPIEQQVMVIFGATQGFLDDVPVNRVQEFQNAFLSYVESSAASLRQTLGERKELTKDLEDQLRQALNDFKAKVWKK
jgi:F-type H+-transporting ATPase subunit alpha